ncbi:pectinesterase [Impatiens glandulifera]|uniref:pectinesterase n=1 Tax=Impatiens glandulifera TaxID=253017 RepID=UPI001FB16D7D|nr:pectinesterase [Impatiens glandulifera]
MIIQFLLISFLFNLVCSQTSTPSNKDVTCWCEKTPYTRQCIHHLTIITRERVSPIIIRDNREFLRATLNAIIVESKKLRDNAKLFESTSSRSKAAWSECSNLYDLTLIQLEQTLDNSNNHTDFDTQTWLSAASTNIHTCLSGFSELGFDIQEDQTDHTNLSKNITALIRNALAINRDWSEKAITTSNNVPRRYFLNTNVDDSHNPHVVVAKDGSGNYGTVVEAINALGGQTPNGKTYVIHIKSGVYKENIVIPVGLNNIMMVGEAVYGSGFQARGISFLNTAGPEGGQSVALASLSDCSIFYGCSFEGYQDTLYAQSNRQFYRDCVITGTVDFIFGNAAAVFQKCSIYTNTQDGVHTNVIAAHGRESPHENTGFSFQNSKVIASYDTFLGRPWKPYARTAYLETYLGGKINPAGWLMYHDESDWNTLCYREYKNYGTGSSIRNRVNWNGYRVMNDVEAEEYSVEKLIDGLSWLPESNIPFSVGL